jgi:uncharacterized membrane protein YfcA
VHLEAAQYAWGALAASIIGFSKTGVPGTGILMVPIMAAVFGGRLSVGATIPMLVFADCMAVSFYRAHARWDHLKTLAPWVIAGLFAGTALLDYFGAHHARYDYLSPVIGTMVLAMLALSLLRGRLGDKMVPTSNEGRALTGLVAGFSTMVSNAAGPVMAIYLTAANLAKNQFMGTTAWYFFIFNLSKVPLLFWLNWRHPNAPIITMQTFIFDLQMFPVIVAAAFSGRWLLPRIPQKPFNDTVLVLAAAAALYLFVPK